MCGVKTSCDWREGWSWLPNLQACLVFVFVVFLQASSGGDWLVFWRKTAVGWSIDM